MQIEQTITQNQIDSDTGAVNATIAEVFRLAGRKGVHRKPIVLVAPIGNRVELMQIVREIKTRCVLSSDIRTLVSPAELRNKVLDDTNPSSSVYINGERLSGAHQRALMESYGDDVKRYLTPEVFIILTSVNPQLLVTQKVWSAEFGEFIGGRIVVVPTAAERETSDLVDLFRSAVRRAAMLCHMPYEIKQGAIDLLSLKWEQERPISLDLVVQGAAKCVADARDKVIELVRGVRMPPKLVITGREVADAFMLDSPLTSTLGTTGPSRRVVIEMPKSEASN